MLKIKSILVLTGLLMLFIGNVGVNVFKHTCKKEGISTAYLLPPEDDHCKWEEPAKKICCSSSEEKKKDDCCNDSVEYFKIKLDYHNAPYHFSPVPVTAILFPVDVFCATTIDEELHSIEYANPPPLLTGREIGIKNQVFII